MTQTRVDVAVVGLGSMGAMALWQLAKRNARGGSNRLTLLGIEQYGGIHAAGAYAGESRLFRVAAKEGRLYTPALLHARRLWQELGASTGRDLLIQAGALSIGPAGHGDLEATLASITEHELPHEVLGHAELRQRYPQFAVREDDIGVLDTLGGAVRPEAAVLAAMEQALEHGAQIATGTEVTAIEPDRDGVLITTSAGERIRAGRAVVTAGPWTTRLLPELSELIEVVSYALTWLMPRHIEHFTPSRFPGFMRDLDEVHAFGVPTLDGYSIKICPHVDLPAGTDIGGLTLTLNREQLRWAGEQARRMIPDLMPEPVRWSVHPEGRTADKMPVIDTLAEGRVVVAGGMSGNGFKFAPVYGQALAELALDGASEWRHQEFTVAAHQHRRESGAQPPESSTSPR